MGEEETVARVVAVLKAGATMIEIHADRNRHRIREKPKVRYSIGPCKGGFTVIGYGCDGGATREFTGQNAIEEAARYLYRRCGPQPINRGIDAWEREN